MLEDFSFKIGEVNVGLSNSHFQLNSPVFAIKLNRFPASVLENKVFPLKQIGPAKILLLSKLLDHTSNFF